MEFYDVVIDAANDAGLSLSQISRRLGKAPNYIANGVGKGASPRLDSATAMLAACGWSLAAMPSDAVPPDALVIDPPDQDEDAERRALERRRARLAADLAAVDEQLGA